MSSIYALNIMVFSLLASSCRRDHRFASAFVDSYLDLMKGGRVMYASSSTAFRMASTVSGVGFAKSNKEIISGEWDPVGVPLVFVPGMKGTHLSFEDSDGITGKSKKKRVWLKLSHLLNIPPRPDGHPTRDLSLPLTYDDPIGHATTLQGKDNCLGISSKYPKQHRGNLVPDGIVDHIIEFSIGAGNKTNNDEVRNFVDLNFLPFYGHTTRLLREMDRRYHKQLHDGKIESTHSFESQDEVGNIESKKFVEGIFDRLGFFVERTSNWAFANTTKSLADEQQSHHPSKHCRPTAIFSYDWRRSLPELCAELHEFCETTFPGQPVQILAHSLGGLMSFAAMRAHPEKYSPGAVVVGVPFETGIQYLQDLHKGYYTELDRCRQFTPEAQFTMSSHWSFFPISKKRLEDRFVDVSDELVYGNASMKFDADVSSIGKPTTSLQPKVRGANAYFDFYNPNEWEKLQLGVFGPEYDNKLTDIQRQSYKDHMAIQMAAAKEWRMQVLGEDELMDDGIKPTNQSTDTQKITNFPPLVACASDKVPTVNQILRRKRQVTNNTAQSALNIYEYDYANGRSVPGDGRIDYDKAFPPSFVAFKKVTLDSAHAKQMCWEESGGSFARVYREVVEQITDYLNREQIQLLEHEKNLSMLQFEEATKSVLARDVSVGKQHIGRRFGFKSLANRTRNVRDELRRMRSKRKSKYDQKHDTITVQKSRFSFRRRR